jgi:hypothetical protein
MRSYKFSIVDFLEYYAVFETFFKFFYKNFKGFSNFLIFESVDLFVKILFVEI